MAKVLDASALLAYLEKESGYEKIKDAFAKATETGKYVLMSVVNWGEVYYILVRDYGLKGANDIKKVVETFPIDFAPVDYEIAEQAALYKAAKKLAYADSFAVALAKLYKAELLTKDREFKAVEDEIKVEWV